jgi:hypothetical protein
MERYDWDRDEDHAVIEYVNRNLREIAERLVDAGVIPAVPDPLPILEP